MQRRTLLQGVAGAAAIGLLPLTAPRAAEKTIVYITPGLDLPFWRYLAKGIEATAKAQGYGFTALDSHNNAATQLKNAQDVIARGVAGICISPTDSSTAPAVRAWPFLRAWLIVTSPTEPVCQFFAFIRSASTLPMP